MLRTGAIGCATVLVAVQARAATEVVPNFTIFSAIEDNARLEDNTAVAGSAKSVVLDAGLSFAAFNERGNLFIEPRVLMNAYSDSQYAALDGDDLFLRSGGEYAWSTSKIGFRSRYRREAIIRAELPDIDNPDFEDDIGNTVPDTADSGQLILIDQDRERFSVSPYAEFGISERSALRLQADVTSVSYTGGSNILRTGFDTRMLRASIVRTPNERNRITATLLARNYEADANLNTTDSVGIIGAIEREISAIWSLNLEAGVERSDYRFQNLFGIIDNASVNYLYSVRARRRNERTQLEFVLDHRPVGSSSGQVVSQDEFRVYVDHALTRRLSTRIAIQADQYQSLRESASINDRDYLRGEFSVTWAMRQKWSIVGGYNYTSQDFTNQGTGVRSSDAIYIGFGYQGLSQR